MSEQTADEVIVLETYRYYKSFAMPGDFRVRQ
jgi:hypothetical protein